MDAATFAVIRAARPVFRLREDKLAYAVHAFLLAQGFKLVAAGPAAETEGQDFAAPREEVEAEGWDSLDGAYAFRYQDIDGKRPPLYVKCLAAGPALLVHWEAGGGAGSSSSADGAVGQAAAAPLELAVDRYTTDASAVGESYQHMDELVQNLQRALSPALVGPGGAATAAASWRAVAGQRSSEEVGPSGRRGSREGVGEEGQQPVHPLQEGPAHRGDSGIGYQPPRWPGPGMGVGADDVVPPGLRPPGLGPGQGPLSGLVQGSPATGSGGMLVGPGHPMFGPGRMGGGVGSGPGGVPPGDLPPGARWDPIAPEGLPGFRPGDFRPDRESQPPRHPVHPDVMQPGSGGNGSFDGMFG